ncbi:hypothetical protein B0H16DRAFT_1024082 [Mycena metata]|uniref:Uncharacterized protein n=1 Tax=Mycena metata TaxID=1033252 RepID=A0AAD7IG19_9AGAR|nr:hypothetical protein B0H16DRAFT_1024082 [Mycena metata]
MSYCPNVASSTDPRLVPDCRPQGLEFTGLPGGGSILQVAHRTTNISLSCYTQAVVNRRGRPSVIYDEAIPKRDLEVRIPQAAWTDDDAEFSWFTPASTWIETYFSTLSPSTKRSKQKRSWTSAVIPLCGGIQSRGRRRFQSSRLRPWKSERQLNVEVGTETVRGVQ